MKNFKTAIFIVTVLVLGLAIEMPAQNKAERSFSKTTAYRNMLGPTRYKTKTKHKKRKNKNPKLAGEKMQGYKRRSVWAG